MFMSNRLCFNSRYTVPRKFKGMLNWNTNPLIITKSPTVQVPAIRLSDPSHIMAVNATLKTRFCPALSKANELAVLSAGRSYLSSCLSYCLISYSSFPKYYGINYEMEQSGLLFTLTDSKFVRASMALVAAALSAAFISFRNLVLAWHWSFAPR